MPYGYVVILKQNMGAAMDFNGGYFGYAAFPELPLMTAEQVNVGVALSNPSNTPLILKVYSNFEVG